jgi:hypothetical protein
MSKLAEERLAQEELGFIADYGSVVCAACVSDESLAEFISEEATATECSFCDSSAKDPIAAECTIVLTLIGEGIQKEWSRAENELGYGSESKSGYVGSTFDSWDVIADLDIIANDKFEEYVIDAFRETVFCQLDPYGLSEGEALHFGWNNLSETVKHRQRFVFLLPDDIEQHDEPGIEIPRAAKMLEELARLIREYQLVKELAAGTRLYRCRPHPVRKRYSTAKALGVPRNEKASQSRMSPAGIPMFYAAEEPETTLAETIDKRTRTKGATIAEFCTSTLCLIIDLSKLPPTPSVFNDDPETVRRRYELGFLHGFLQDLSSPIERDGCEHIDYVPTQVVCEYLRHAFRDEQRRPVDGLAWESTRRPGARNIVLFIDRDQCVERGERPSDVSELAVELVTFEVRRLP